MHVCDPGHDLSTFRACGAMSQLPLHLSGSDLLLWDIQEAWAAWNIEQGRPADYKVPKT
jgi:hypothetical protein